MEARALSLFSSVSPREQVKPRVSKRTGRAGVCRDAVGRPLKRRSAHMKDNDIDLDSPSTTERGFRPALTGAQFARNSLGRSVRGDGQETRS
jgi:hypothetical protein